MTKEEAQKAIAYKLAEISVLYQECAEIAEKANVYFHYNGPAGYGDGGSYWPGYDEGWSASSQSC
jgi:hypothetical protein